MSSFSFASPRVAFLLFALAACSGGCARPPTSPAERARAALANALEEGRARWQSVSLRDYDFDYATGGFAAPQRVTIRVRGGEVRAVESLLPNAPAGDLSAYPTVDAVFKRLERAQAGDEREGDLRDATFDPKLGFPTHATFRNATELWDFTILRLTPRASSP